VDQARADVEPLLADAKQAVRFQRGTRRDLALYAEDWATTMDCIANPESGAGCRTALDSTAAEMRSLAGRLDRR
jgi:hypothetical protein